MPKNPDSVARTRSRWSDRAICSESILNDSETLGSTDDAMAFAAPMTGAADPVTLTRYDTPLRPPASCECGRYTIGSGVSRIDWYLVSSTTPTIMTGGERRPLSSVW